MDFNLTEERSMLRDMLQRFLAENYDHETRRALLASGAVYSAPVLTQLAELGVLGALFTEEQGGFGGQGFDISVVFEEFGRAGLIEPVLGNAVLAGSLLAQLGSDDQTRRLEAVCSGTEILAFAHSEAEARYDLSHVAAKATETETGIVLSGVKSYVLNGAQAQVLIVSARESGAVTDTEGVSLFLVPIETAGTTIVNQMNIDGTALARVTFDDVTLPKSARLGGAGQAYKAIEAATARATLAICAEALGAMDAAKELTLAYLRERKQFGVPIGSFQALQHRMADVLIEIEQARSAVINLAGHIDAPRDLRERHVSATKNLIGRVGALVAEECIQMHGGIGMTDEYALSHYARRLVMIDHVFGDTDHHLERFIQLLAA